MKASVVYRIAAVLLLLFSIGHTLGFRLLAGSVWAGGWHLRVLGFARVTGDSTTDKIIPGENPCDGGKEFTPSICL